MLLDKEKIIQEMKRLNLPKNQYWVLMGAALVLHGVKDYTSDLDLGCTGDLFATLIDKGYALSPSNSGYEKIALAPCIFIYKEWLADTIVSIDGIPVADIDSIVRDKSRLGRQKDANDIAMIKRFLDMEEISQ